MHACMDASNDFFILFFGRQLDKIYSCYVLVRCRNEEKIAIRTDDGQANTALVLMMKKDVWPSHTHAHPPTPHPKRTKVKEKALNEL